jgi:Mg2+-importing ATPase
LAGELGSSLADGLSASQAAARLAERGRNVLHEEKEERALVTFLRQLKNPLSWLLLFAVIVSSVAGEWTDAGVVLAILFLGALLGFVQERRASRAVAALRAQLELRCDVIRGAAIERVPCATVVPGDLVVLAAGATVPADGIVVMAKDLFVSESVLTGESHAVEKEPGPSPANATLAARRGSLFQGTSVQSGTGHLLVVTTGAGTEYGRIAERLTLRPPETAFDHGLRRFGTMLMWVMLVLVLSTTTANLLGHKPPIESLLFAIALAVGLAPEMLPAIVAVTLSRGAQKMAERGVIVRKLSAIENFGAIDVFCTDKTGTLTEGNVIVRRASDAGGQESARAMALAFTNAKLQCGLPNPIDVALIALAAESEIALAGERLDEVPYDFSRKRLSILVRGPDGPLLITKGAVKSVMAVATSWRDAEGAVVPLTDATRASIEARIEALGAEGVRALGVATRKLEGEHATKADEREMTLEGLLELADPPKAGAAEAIADLRALGVAVKVVSGDAASVVRHLAQAVGIDAERVLTGAELAALGDEALWHVAERVSLFAEVDPNQKERVILALRKTGHVVGYMGDGVNDAPALHAADVGVSVFGATDVAREASDFVLVKRDLGVLHAGIAEGRATFANTLKYLFTTESANFGNMISMAVAAAFLPFLPLLAGQVLLNNFLSDVPAMAIAGDAVDPELVQRPVRWDIRELRRFMITFGLVSSVFDLLTFGVLVWFVRAPAPEFRTSWFVESLLTEVVVALVVRTRRPFWRSRPGRALLALSGAVALVACALPYTPLGALVALVPLPLTLLAGLVGISMAYALTVEVVKRRFWSSARERVLSKAA